MINLRIPYGIILVGLISSPMFCIAYQTFHSKSKPIPLSPDKSLQELLPAPHAEEIKGIRTLRIKERGLIALVQDSLPVDWSSTNKFERWGIWVNLKEKYLNEKISPEINN